MTALELTPAEQAAMRTDLHATTCPVPLGECVECMTVFRTIRRIIVAVTPVIEEQARRAYFADDAAIERDWLLAEASVELRARFFVARAKQAASTDGADSDRAPVAAASIPIPDGEELVDVRD